MNLVQTKTCHKCKKDILKIKGVTTFLNNYKLTFHCSTCNRIKV